MQSNEIYLGLQDLKLEFIARTETTTPIEKLKLEITLNEHDLILREKTNHEKSMAVAVYNDTYTKWSYFLTTGTPRRRLIQDFIESYPIRKMMRVLNVMLR